MKQNTKAHHHHDTDIDYDAVHELMKADPDWSWLINSGNYQHDTYEDELMEYLDHLEDEIDHPINEDPIFGSYEDDMNTSFWWDVDEDDTKEN